MLVKQILTSKADDKVVTLAPGSSISDAARLIAEKRIGAVVISSNGDNVLGILSERDIVTELGRRGPACLSDTADDVMTKNPVTCTVDMAADQILATMTEGRFRHMPVVGADGKMIGLITLGDVIKARLMELSMEKDALEGMIMGH